jgi:hypothetical protein
MISCLNSPVIIKYDLLTALPNYRLSPAMCPPIKEVMSGGMLMYIRGLERRENHASNHHGLVLNIAFLVMGLTLKVISLKHHEK